MSESTTKEAANVSPEMAAAVGREMTRKVSFPVSASDIRKWAIAVYYPQPAPERYLRGAALIAPEEFNPFAWLAAESRSTGSADVEDNDPDRTEKSLGVPPPGLKFQLNGGMTVEYGASIRAGDVITSVGTLAGYHERAGRLGLMLITTFQESWTNQDGEHVKTSQTTLIRY